MNYSQILKLDYDELSYRQFLYTCALYKRIPFRVMLFESEKESGTLIVFSRTKSNTITTRHMKFNKVSAERIAERLEADFKGLSVETIPSIDEVI